MLGKEFGRRRVVEGGKECRFSHHQEIKFSSALERKALIKAFDICEVEFHNKPQPVPVDHCKPPQTTARIRLHCIQFPISEAVKISTLSANGIKSTKFKYSITVIG